MDRQCCKGLSCSLREADIRERGLARGRKNVINAVRNVMESELINRVVPERRLCWGVIDALLGVLVSAVVSKLDAVSGCARRRYVIHTQTS